MDLDIDLHTPEQAADFICAKAKRLMALGIPKVIAHGLNEQHTNRPKARAWELRFIERCHVHWGVETVCSNYPFANFDNDEAKDFIDVWRESDYNGPHRYDLILPDGSFHDRLETSLRHRKWRDYPMEKDLCTEFGIEDGGWQRLGISPERMQERMLENVRLWKEEGGHASHFFCVSHIDEQKWGPYYALDSMYKFWGENSPPFEPGGIVPVPPQLDQAIVLLRNSQEQTLQFKEKVNQAKTDNVTWFQMAEDLEKGDSQAGAVYNQNATVLRLLEEAKKALSPAAPLSISEPQSPMVSGLTPHSPQSLGDPDHLD
jgi:hypothetical protein